MKDKTFSILGIILIALILGCLLGIAAGESDIKKECEKDGYTTSMWFVDNIKCGEMKK